MARGSNNARTRNIIKRLLENKPIQEEAIRLRKLAPLGFPWKGFASEEDYLDYSRRLQRQTVQGSRSWHKLLELEEGFMVSANSQLKKIGVHMSYGGIRKALSDIFLYGVVLNDSLKSANAWDCSLIELDKADFAPERTDLETGLYIRLGFETDVKDLIDFVKNKRALINGIQNSLRARLGMSKRKKLRRSSSPLASEIEKYQDMTISDLQRISGNPSKSRPILLAAILSKNLGKDIFADRVDKYVKRKRKRERGEDI